MRIILIFFLTVNFLFSQNTAITVSNNDIALVKEERQIKLNKGIQTIDLLDIPNQINAASVLVESIDNSFEVLEQNYEYDLVNSDKLLEKSIGSVIEIEHPQQGRITGKLLSAGNGNAIIEGSEGSLQIISLNSEQKITLKDITAENNPFILKPTLIWLVESEKEHQAQMNLSYLTNGVSWNADYVGLLNENDTEIVLSAWVTIRNSSGKEFRNAKLKLMAGDIKLVQDKPSFQMQRRAVESFVAKSSFEEKSFFEYHLYTLDRKTDLANNQTKQIQLFGETSAKVKKLFRIDSNQPQDVSVLVTFSNSEKNNLGMPLPEGVVRIYKKDKDEREFIGENRIKHTPKNETIEIEVGNAFDIASERTVVDVKRPSKRSEIRTVEYSLKNHKKEKVVLEIVEQIPMYSEVDLLNTNAKLVEKKADRIITEITLQPSEEKTAKLEYSMRW